MKENEEIIQDLLKIDFRTHLQTEILQLLKHIKDIEYGNVRVSKRKYMKYTKRLTHLIMEWEEHFKDEPYLMKVYLK